MKIERKKRTFKLTTAGKLVVSMIVLFAITTTLYLKSSNQAMAEDIVAIKKDVVVIKELNKEMKAQLNILQEEEANELFNSFNFVEPPAGAGATTYQACNPNATFKSFMDYRKITNQATRNYDLQLVATTNNKGMRMVQERFAVALASHNVGDLLNVYLSDGGVLEVIVGDLKDVECTHLDGSVMEFIVDTQIMDIDIKKSGDFNDRYSGTITLIENVGNYYD